jgi:hypothetical protein
MIFAVHRELQDWVCFRYSQRCPKPAVVTANFTGFNMNRAQTYSVTV